MMTPRHYLEQFQPGKTAGTDRESFELVILWTENPEIPSLFGSEYLTRQDIQEGASGISAM